MKRLRWTVAMAAAAVLLAGCGEVTNTLTPQSGTANVVTVALDTSANFSQVGIYEAEALGYFKQTDEVVRFIVNKHPIDALHDHTAQIAVTPEPDIIEARNRHTALASVAAILQGPQRVLVDCPGTSKSSKPAGSGTSATKASKTKTPATKTQPAATTTQTAATTGRSHPPLHACTTEIDSTPFAEYASAPTYNALDFVVTENEIVNNAPIIRRFVQAVGRGYAAVRANPTQATENMIKLNPALKSRSAQQLAGVKASISNFFPSGSAKNRPWGWQQVKEWNRFGTWLLDHKIITDVDATPDADTNELLAGQGV